MSFFVTPPTAVQVVYNRSVLQYQTTETRKTKMSKRRRLFYKQKPENVTNDGRVWCACVSYLGCVFFFWSQRLEQTVPKISWINSRICVTCRRSLHPRWCRTVVTDQTKVRTVPQVVSLMGVDANKVERRVKKKNMLSCWTSFCDPWERSDPVDHTVGANCYQVTGKRAVVWSWSGDNLCSTAHLYLRVLRGTLR